MGMTMTQKILAAHAGLESVVPGQLIEADLHLYRIILHRIKILNQQNTANVYANMQKHRELQIILKLARWELSMPFCRKKV